MSLIPKCRYCRAPVMFFTKNKKMFATDRDTGKPHLCREKWMVINEVFEHTSVRGARQLMHWSQEQLLLKKLKAGPVFQHEIGPRQQDILSHLKKALSGSGVTIESYWCCPLGTRMHVREKVYSLTIGFAGSP